MIGEFTCFECGGTFERGNANATAEHVEREGKEPRVDINDETADCETCHDCFIAWLARVIEVSDDPSSSRFALAQTILSTMQPKYIEEAQQNR